ncbi:MAG: M24 family metallopeptidase [Sulfurovum sp.]|nr:M24 family metallopeptidase [Sulfurovum sp.]MCB4761344.1 M24 family metallopeptidase [Sulfurovum sp.]MCB4764708.1 M24 family metallopeptidase [Sulfurovum sp.]MCB4772600.1 M24 family metallopeptidase [Sulfurovum sp.]MCB4782740.1 M24 family metallopeptidase [Sulfurovum sp.]
MNYILKDENAIYYECGYSCDNALYLCLGEEAFFITDSRYTVDAQEHVRGAEVVIDGDLYGRAAKILKRAKVKKVIFDPKEWCVAGFKVLTSKTKIYFKPEPSFSHKKRIIKTDMELKTIARAAKLGTKAFKRLAEIFKQDGFGKDELSLAYMTKSVLSSFGKYDLSFDPIVAINANAAKPHAMPSKTRLRKGDLLLVDAGLKYKRYCSDKTRTVFVENNFQFKPKQSFNQKKIQKVYDTVLKAHDNAIKKAQSGMKAKKIDALTRNLIEKAGFGKYYVHSTGHGVGLDIHEMPYITSKSETIIEDGMVFTIEPGIYIPGEFGIRIEDMVVMMNARAQVL